nr:immunoglobulin heavy chain junction region [Macaca mulatta]MPN83945.1 immunoglobulin heavy chain junction region [Macaca mulatta]MPN84040.1 immunoglobulin heavy chain junction region [Macaca mulatta]MPN84174.1 immunoglobulin heavy chain junction region [Macaca mulatta]MPN84197.1 immunoglobulin heavy chain junction region [Macaca mulatta]
CAKFTSGWSGFFDYW